jgi:hypothetical protein
LDGSAIVSEDVPVRASLPASYRLELQRPPPESAMVPKTAILNSTAAPDYEFATGTVVAYEDRNGNGQLDLVPIDAGFIDRIVAANSQTVLMYQVGTLPPPGGLAINNIRGEPVHGYELFGHSCEESGTSDGGGCFFSFFPMDQPYDLVVSDDPAVSALMCQTYGQNAASAPDAGTMSTWNVATQGTPPGGYPDPCAPNLGCAPDGTEYSIATSCVPLNPVCTQEAQCASQTLVLGGPSPPAGWPCPLVGDPLPNCPVPPVPEGGAFGGPPSTLGPL